MSFGNDCWRSIGLFWTYSEIHKKLKTLLDVGLGYMKIGQPATTLSGGEAQRIKLAKELSRSNTGNTLYILDEPTTGLHFADIKRLLSVLARLTDAGNSVVVIEHNLDVIKTADYIIDLGPEGMRWWWKSNSYRNSRRNSQIWNIHGWNFYKKSLVKISHLMPNSLLKRKWASKFSLFQPKYLIKLWHINFKFTFLEVTNI